MAKKDYTNWDRNDLIKEIDQLRKRKKYGLVWEDKPENVVEQCKKELPVLEEVKEKEISTDRDKPVNLLIEGDNFHALSVLNYTHKNKIDLIYIDPPYNTGARDWKYNNDYVDINDVYRHSKWLSFMEKRLVLAKNLLKKDGVLIVAIDDNEVHRLKLILEEIYPGYDITSVTIVQNPRGNITNNFARVHEYALFVIPRGVSAILRTKKKNDNPRKLRRWGHNSTREARPTMFYPIYIKNDQITEVGAIPDNNYHPEFKNTVNEQGMIAVWPIDQNGVERRWNFGLDSIHKHFERLIAIKVKGEWDVFVSDEISTSKTVWTEPEMEAGRNGATLVKNITGADFPYPKSIYNLKKCLDLVIGNKPNAIVLDYFAGSGTLGHATLMQNEEDGGERKFILCTNNEDNNGEGTKIASDICYPRIKKVIEGYRGIVDNKETSGFGGKLKYFKTSFVPADPTDKNRIELTQKAIEMLCVKEDTFDEVESKVKYKIFSNKTHYTGIIFDHQAIDNFKKAIKDIDGRFSVYVFSLGDDTFDEEFDDIKSKVKLSPIPEAILRVYRRIFK